MKIQILLGYLNGVLKTRPGVRDTKSMLKLTINRDVLMSSTTPMKLERVTHHFRPQLRKSDIF